MMKRLYMLMACMLMVYACGNTTAGHETTETSDAKAHETTLEEDIGEMLLVGFRGIAVDSTTHIWRDLTHFHVGGVLLFDMDAATGKRGRNIISPTQVQSLCRSLRKASPSILIGIDQEGGYVSRLHPRYGFAEVASAKKSGQNGMDSVRASARRTAEMLRTAGINLNFAPVADVDVNSECPVIGWIERSFSPSPEYVRDCCHVWIEEQRKAGIISCMKHFPGHGSATGDTHKGLVDVSKTWQRKELFPYQGLKEEVPMVMTAHVINRQLDPSGLPASLSAKITAYLRDSIGFDGVIITDDMAMGAIVKQYSFETAIEMAVEAGTDVICLSNNGGIYDAEMVPKAVRTIRKMVESGKTTSERIHTSAERVRKMKASFGLTKNK